MVETPRSSAENLSTSREAIYWTENSQNSKLNQIKGLLEKSDNQNIKNLMNFIVKQDYVGLQRAIGYKYSPDGKLGKNSLEATEHFINNCERDSKEKEVEEGTNSNVKRLAEDISTLYRPKKEVTNTGIRNIRINRGERWNASLGKTEKYEEEEGFIVEGTKIIIKNLHPLIYDNMFSNEKINETMNDIHIKFNGNNIILNNKYVINPIGIIGYYKDINQIDKRADNLRQKSQCGVIKPLYDYLNKNKDKFEKQEYGYTSAPIKANGEGYHNNHFDNDSRKSTTREQETGEPADSEITLNEGVPENLERKKANKSFRNVEVPEFEASSGYWSVSGNMDLNISNIAKEGNTIYLNNGDIKITYNDGNREVMSLEMRTNRHHIVRWKYLNTEVLRKGSAGEKWELIYKQLNKEYFG